jgi:4'-phosphopantetheinyl transferase
MEPAPWSTLKRPLDPELKPGLARLWIWKLDASQEAVTAMAGLLSPGERARAGRFKFEADRRRYVAAHAGLRRILGCLTGAAAEELQFKFSARGKPRLETQPPGEPLFFNLSHSADFALLGVLKGNEIGVDLESERELDFLEIAKGFHAEEREWLEAHREHAKDAFFRLWTLREAVFKAAGESLFSGPKFFSVLPESGGLGRVKDPFTGGLRSEWLAQNIEAWPGFKAAVAFESADGRRFEVESLNHFEYSHT